MAVAVAGCLLGATGCKKRLDPEEYGQVVEGVPRVPGAEKPRELPELQGDDKIPPGAEQYLK
jgi:hypothetical protein